MSTARPIGLTLEGTFPVADREADFVAELQAGREEAFEQLVAAYQHPVFNLVAHIVETPADASDVLQDVFVKIYRGIKGYKGDSSLRTWIYRIAVHEALNHRRGWLRRHWREAVSIDDVESASAAVTAEVAANSQGPYQALEQAEREAAVRQALASLSPPYRMVMVLREMEELSYEEIAQVLGLAVGTVKSRLLRGREFLRRKLAAYVGKEHVRELR